MRGILQDLQFEVPYSTFTPPLRAAGDNPPLKFGASCLGLSSELKDRLEHYGYSPEFIAQGAHYGIIVKDGGLFFLDPSLMQMEPLDVAKCFREPGQHKYPAYPIISGNPSKIIVESVGAEKFKVRKFHCADLEEMEVAEFTFNIANCSPTAPRESQLDFVRSIKHKLLMTVLDTDGSLTVVSQFLKAGIKSLMQFDSKGQRSRGYFPGDEKFAEDIAVVARKVGANAKELMAHFDSALVAYNSCKKLY